MALTHIMIYQYQGDIGSEPLKIQVESNMFEGGTVGVELDDAQENDVVGNRFEGTTTAVNALEDANDNAIYSNRFSNCSVGVQIQTGANDNVIHGNIFRDNATDISNSGTGTIDTDND